MECGERRTDEDISGAGVYDERRAESVKIMEDQGSKDSNDSFIANIRAHSWFLHLSLSANRSKNVEITTDWIKHCRIL